MRTAAGLFLPIACAAVCAVQGAAAETRAFDVDDFDAVEASNGIRVEVTLGAEETSVRAEGPSLELDQVYVDVKRGRLIVRPSMGVINNDYDFHDVVVYVAAETVVDIESENGAELRARGFKASQHVELEATNGGILEATGDCGSAELVARRGGELDASALECGRVKARASMGGVIGAYARDAADLGASWGGEIDVEGSPERVRTNNPVSAEIRVR